MRPEVGIASDALGDAAATDARVGEVFLSADELRSRVEELGVEISRDYENRALLLVSLLKASFVFLTDLSRAIPIEHQIDFVELTGYNGADTGGHSRVRLLKDTAIPVTGHDVLLVQIGNDPLHAPSVEERAGGIIDKDTMLGMGSRSIAVQGGVGPQWRAK